MNMPAIVETSWAELQMMRAAYGDAESGGQGRLTFRARLAERAEDWLYFEAARPDTDAFRLTHSAFSPSLGVYRGISLKEISGLDHCTQDAYKKRFGRIPDPIALLSEDPVAGRSSRFTITLSYTVEGDDPESALASLLGGTHPEPPVIAEIRDHRTENVTNLDKDEILKITGVDPEPLDEAPDGP